MGTYCALTVRKLKPGTYDQWRQAWWPESAEEIPEGRVYIVRNVKDPDEIIAFGVFTGDLEAFRNAMDPEAERDRQEAMAPFVESIGADGMYEVVEMIAPGTPANVGGQAPA